MSALRNNARRGVDIMCSSAAAISVSFVPSLDPAANNFDISLKSLMTLSKASPSFAVDKRSAASAQLCLNTVRCWPTSSAAVEDKVSTMF